MKNPIDGVLFLLYTYIKKLKQIQILLEELEIMNVEWAKEEMSRTGKKQCNKDFIYYVMRGKTNNNRIDWIDLSALPKKEYKGKKSY